jgi:hypothetical protein
MANSTTRILILRVAKICSDNIYLCIDLLNVLTLLFYLRPSRTYVFDIDSTLAFTYYLPETKSLNDVDLGSLPVFFRIRSLLLEAFSERNSVTLILSARSNTFRLSTTYWLNSNHIPYHKLILVPRVWHKQIILWVLCLSKVFVFDDLSYGQERSVVKPYHNIIQSIERIPNLKLFHSDVISSLQSESAAIADLCL